MTDAKFLLASLAEKVVTIRPYNMADLHVACFADWGGASGTVDRCVQSLVESGVSAVDVKRI